MNVPLSIADEVQAHADVSDSLSRLAVAIEAADVVSFDVFDTLFVRLVADPEDVFDLIGDRFGIPEFRRLRQQAQQRAFQRMRETGAQEITLSGIYTCMSGLPDSVSALELEAAEYELELVLTVPNPHLLEIFRQAVARKPVVITSDMYLPKSFFEALFDRHGLPHVPMFISADRNATKRDAGRLFDMVASDMAVSHPGLLHVGDNALSDVRRAAERGLASYHYQPLMKAESVGSLGASLAEGMACMQAEALPSMSLRKMGFRYGGPTAMGLLQWIGEQSKADDIDLLLFVSRDGYVLDRMATEGLVEGLPPYAYFPGSRVALYLSAMTEGNFENYLDFLLSGSMGLTPSEVLERIGVPAPDDAVLADLDLGHSVVLGADNASLPRLKIFLHAYRHEILKICRRNRRGLHNLLCQLGVQPGMRVAMVDVGWNGTTQEAMHRALRDIMDVSLHGYYLALVDTPERHRRGKLMPMKAMFSAKQAGADAMNALYVRRVGIEMMFSAPHGSIIGYDAKPGRAVRAVEDAGRGADVASLNSAVLEIQAGMLDFCRQYAALRRQTGHAVSATQLAKVAIEFAQLPAEKCAALNDLSNFDAWGSSRNLNLTMKSYLNN
jgi:predicted HAD superfamily hydrolase